MEDEEDIGRVALERPNLEILSIAELEGYIADLEAEIARTRAMIQAKAEHRGDADSFFRS